MATFRIGQRVRVVRSPRYPELVGTQTTIIAGPIPRYGSLKYLTAQRKWGRAECFEPIVDEGRQVTTWEKCLWQPNKETVCSSAS